jgi:hypothetical protein
MKRVVVLSAALALIVVPALSLAQSTTDRDIPLAGATSVRLNAEGHIHVLDAAAGDALHLHVVNYGPPSPPLRIEASREGSRIDASISGPRESVVPIGATGFTVDISVPRNVKLDLRSFSGTIHVDRVRAPMQLYTADGDITVDAADAPLTAYADIGSVTVARARNMIELTSGQGNVTATLANGWSANLVRLESSQGNVRLNVPRGFRARYDTTSEDGHVHNGLASFAHAPLVFMLTQKGDVTVGLRPKS